MNAPKLILRPLRRLAVDARTFAFIAHDGQVDKAGLPYDGHLNRVARSTRMWVNTCPGLSEDDRDEAVQIAWLHDVIEDTPYGARNLLDEGFSRRVVDAVSLLTKPDHPLPYQLWIERLIDVADLQALIVKLADITDNMDAERLAKLPADVRERLCRKYGPAYEALFAAAKAKGLP